ncbi:MAG TPA: tetraacyldisaccharide 4'-kinase [Desulfuromonadales bacterium]|nr:tetraacyldisaccharide 4'-kinase [Desulfuromonadales bacterium]
MNVTYQTYWKSLVERQSGTQAELFLLRCLNLASWFYSLVLKLRAYLYRRGIFKTCRLPRPVLSIGNITVGGTGKTPFTVFCARYLLAQGHKVAVLSRGYGGSLEGQTCIVSDGATVMMSARECGDEPYLLATKVPGLMVVIGSDRYAAGQLAMAQLQPDIFLLDDGFQHLRLHRDLNLLLLDYAQPFGNGRTLPAGVLREPREAARRADVILYTRCPSGAVKTSDMSDKLTCMSQHQLSDVIALAGRPVLPFSDLQNRSVLAFAGIAAPESFFDGLRSKGVQLNDVISFPDHVDYDETRIDGLAEAMRSSGADCFITTEKDGVKLKGLPPELADRTYCARLNLAIDDPAPLLKLLRELKQQSATATIEPFREHRPR